MTLLPDWLTEQSISRELEAMLRNRSPESLETMAARSRAMTLRRFGRTMTLYAPLYLSNYCSSGCAYCGFASDRTTPRRKLDEEEIRREIAAMKQLGIQDTCSSLEREPLPSALNTCGARWKLPPSQCSESPLRPSQ